MPEYNAYCVVSHAHVNVSVKRRKIDSRKIMLAVMVSAFSGPGNEGTIRTTRGRGVIRGMTCPHVLIVL